MASRITAEHSFLIVDAPTITVAYESQVVTVVVVVARQKRTVALVLEVARIGDGPPFTT